MARGIFGSKIHYADSSYAALTGADALAIVTEWNEFREPDYARMRKLMRSPVIFDGRNIYNPGEPAIARVHLHLDGTSVSAVLVTGGAGYIGSHASKALAARGESVVVYDNFSQGHRAATGRATAVVEGDIQDTAKLVGDDQGTQRRCRHALRGVAVGRRLGEGSGRLLSQQRRRRAVGARRHGGDRRPAPRVLVDLRGLRQRPTTTPIHEDLPKRPINAYGETKLAIEHALPHFEQAYGLRSVALRYFNAAGADPDGELGEDHAPEIHVIPRALDTAMGRGSFRDLRR